MTGHYLCDHWFPPDDDHPDGRVCGKAFYDLKAKATHSKCHRTRPCRWCARDVSVNGHTQHEASCDQQPHAFPWQVLDDLLSDLVMHATDIPTDVYCVVSVSRGASFMTQEAVVQAVLLSPETTVIIPTDLIRPPDATARWRRKELHDTAADKETEPSDKPRPHPNGDRSKPGGDQLLFGVDWTTVP